VGFYNLLNKLKPHQIFIYASSSSVYSGQYGAKETSDKFESHNMYDLSKFSMDCLARIHPFPLNFYSLRFGTVNGVSPQMREDLIVNAMVKSALTKNMITVTNGHNYRPILWIRDLARAVNTIIQQALPERSGIYNLCSFNDTIENIALSIGRILSCPVEIKEGGSPAYDFSITADKFEKGFNFKFEGSIEKVVNELLIYYRKEKKCV